MDFLYDLMRLDEDAASSSDLPGRPAHELPERRAAKGLFRWEVRPEHKRCELPALGLPGSKLIYTKWHHKAL